MKNEISEIEKVVQENKMRVGFHPDYLTVLNTPRKEILQSFVKDLFHDVVDNLTRLPDVKQITEGIVEIT
ncbi:hypothetical protein MK805_11065 [Shimazuella sp. AN120528]|uniref:hypothetical protein n=1 Tax=Shimazuella soli TaxID=1892854 RepID=UPI001F0E61D3|nr:hypothetical protein [Shimazuella soli]MCH5585492.1 hypothetical protein [Shimazuella soli]